MHFKVCQLQNGLPSRQLLAKVLPKRTKPALLLLLSGCWSRISSFNRQLQFRQILCQISCCNQSTSVTHLVASTFMPPPVESLQAILDCASESLSRLVLICFVSGPGPVGHAGPLRQPARGVPDTP